MRVEIEIIALIPLSVLRVVFGPGRSADLGGLSTALSLSSHTHSLCVYRCSGRLRLIKLSRDDVYTNRHARRLLAGVGRRGVCTHLRSVIGSATEAPGGCCRCICEPGGQRRGRGDLLMRAEGEAPAERRLLMAGRAPVSHPSVPACRDGPTDHITRLGVAAGVAGRRGPDLQRAGGLSSSLGCVSQCRAASVCPSVGRRRLIFESVQQQRRRRPRRDIAARGRQTDGRTYAHCGADATAPGRVSGYCCCCCCGCPGTGSDRALIRARPAGPPTDQPTDRQRPD